MFNHALVALDLTPAGETVVIGIPDLMRLGVRRVTLFHAASLELPAAEAAGEVAAWREQLERLRPELETDGFQVAVEVARGIPARAILDAAERADADLIVVGSHGGESEEAGLFLDQVAAEVLAASPRPVLLERMGPGSAETRISCVTRFSTVLLATDGQPSVRRAEETARTLCAEAERMTLLGVVDPGDDAGHQQLQAHLEALVGDCRDKTHLRVVQGTPSAMIMREAADRPCTVIVVGRHGKPDHPVLGGTTETLCRNARHPVLVVPPDASA